MLTLLALGLMLHFLPQFPAHANRGTCPGARADGSTVHEPGQFVRGDDQGRSTDSGGLDASLCCVACTSRAIVDGACVADLPSFQAASNPMQPFRLPPESDERSRSPLGWTSSWSSRAPPPSVS